jgi:CRISPR-associated protein Csa2
MRGGFLSLSARVVVNAEAMNMVEAIGNTVRHGKAAHVYKFREGQNERYEIRTVPVVSGEALRHAVQKASADVAEGVGLPVCGWCRRGEFVKHGVVLGEFFRDVKGAGSVAGFEEAAGRGVYEVEGLILGSCVVEDVGGFLRAPVEGASVLGVGYLVPAVEGGRVLCGFAVRPREARAWGSAGGRRGWCLGPSSGAGHERCCG